MILIPDFEGAIEAACKALLDDLLEDSEVAFDVTTFAEAADNADLAAARIELDASVTDNETAVAMPRLVDGTTYEIHQYKMLRIEARCVCARHGSASREVAKAARIARQVIGSLRTLADAAFSAVFLSFIGPVRNTGIEQGMSQEGDRVETVISLTFEAELFFDFTVSVAP